MYLCRGQRLCLTSRSVSVLNHGSGTRKGSTKLARGPAHSRRGTLVSTFLIGSNLVSDTARFFQASARENGIVADVPLLRLKLPDTAAGRDYPVVQIKIKGEGPFNFLVDTGLTAELITPHLQQVLNLHGTSSLAGLGAGGSVKPGELVEIIGASLWPGNAHGLDDSGLQLPTLTAVVADFPQEHLDPALDPVEGMLGMELLQCFDTDFDFVKGRLRFW
eukprot:CAMPEP_0177578084 /NCGR_PEP_ID=MMETSP0419_2-20121207/140_1 /TAXON_ID=582737 /ORGANISM="Tetraselmis sp., Strain GSL018" /LENGTH=218 /DNA_ID=CAMNT_0019066465 /DNA_START=130 /DNA_END=783 /DNA_ORIENTATION=+